MSQFLKQENEYSTEHSQGIDFDDAVNLPAGGSTCDIYRTRWQRRDVFVKRLKEPLRSKPLYLDALDKEFDVGVNLRHPSLPDYREFHRDYIIMDYIDGETIAVMIKRNDPWLTKEKNIVAMLRELIDVVDYLHRHNVVHCDIKPDNIMIRSNTRHLVLIDFDKSYTDALRDTSGHPSKYGLEVDEVGRTAIDFRGIGLVVEQLKNELPDFNFSVCEHFVKACYKPDASCEELTAILDNIHSNFVDEHRREYLTTVEERLYKAFRRKQEPKTMYKCVPRYISPATIQATKNIAKQDVIDAVTYSQRFRLRNLATAASRGSNAPDRLVVEMFPQNTTYGCCIDRGSDITIVCPTALSEAGIGNFAYYLALIGGFNYISKEVEEDIDDPTSFYIIPDKRKGGSFENYLSDLKRLLAGKNKWTIFLISSETKKEADIHFLTTANIHTNRSTTILDQDGFDHLYNMVTREMEDTLGIKTDINRYRPAGPKNVSVIIGGGIETNAFTIRIFSEMMVWDTRYMAVAKTLAEAIDHTLSTSNGKQMPDTATLKESGLGYQQ